MVQVAQALMNGRVRGSRRKNSLKQQISRQTDMAKICRSGGVIATDLGNEMKITMKCFGSVSRDMILT